MRKDLTGGDQHVAISAGQPTRGGQHQLQRLTRLPLGHPRTGQAAGQHHGGGHVTIRLAHLGHQLGQLTRCRSIRRRATRRLTALRRTGRAVISHGLTPAVAVAIAVWSLAVPVV